jgi:protein-disulfide isomerase
MTEPESESAPPGSVTIHLRRGHLWLAVALVAALAAGFALGRTSGVEPQAILYTPAGVGAVEDARATSNAPRAPDVDELADRPSRGSEDAAVTMVEFVDFECPFCGAYARDTLSRIDEEYGDRIRYVSIQFPLAVHAHARQAARAAVCADDAGVYWEYHELLFDHQDRLDEDGLVDLAAEAGAPRGEFVSCLSSTESRDRVDADVELAVGLGVRSTPTLFVDGEPMVGAQSFSQFRTVIDDALATD